MTRPVPHHHEAWQIQQGADGPYCAACGESTKPQPRLPMDSGRPKPQPRLPSPYRPEPRPHVARMLLVLALVGVLLLATAWLASEITRPSYVVPPGVTRPAWATSDNPTPQGTVPPNWPYNPEQVWGK